MLVNNLTNHATPVASGSGIAEQQAKYYNASYQSVNFKVCETGSCWSVNIHTLRPEDSP